MLNVKDFLEKRRLNVAVENQDTIVSQTNRVKWYQFSRGILTTGGKENGNGKAGGIPNLQKKYSSG